MNDSDLILMLYFQIGFKMTSHTIAFSFFRVSFGFATYINLVKSFEHWHTVTPKKSQTELSAHLLFILYGSSRFMQGDCGIESGVDFHVKMQFEDFIVIKLLLGY